MTKSKALNDFYNSFGINAYPSQRVPDNVTFPYMTYEAVNGSNGVDTAPRIALWYYGDSEKPINDKVDSITREIGLGKSIKCDDGVICIYCNEGWQYLTDQADTKIVGRYTNLLVTFNTY